MSVMTKGFELYLHPDQNSGTIGGFELEAHLKETGRLDRALGLEDEVVKGWIANPATYPEELKEKLVFLWKSALDRQSHRDLPTHRDVPFLFWNSGGEEVIVAWSWLDEDEWSHRCISLLSSSS